MDRPAAATSSGPGVGRDAAALARTGDTVPGPDAALVDERCPSCGGDAGDNWFDRSLCPCEDTMHTRCSNCGAALDGCSFDQAGAVERNKVKSGEAAPPHGHRFLVFPEGEALCFECGDLYIFQTTLHPSEVEEYREYAKEVGLLGD